MGKKPVLGIVSALCVGLALTGCRNCSSCPTDGARVAKEGPATFKPQPTFQTNSAAAAPANSANNSATPAAKPTIPTAPDLSAPLGMDKTGLKPTEPLASSKPSASGVQTTGFVTPATTAPTTTIPDAPAPADANTSHFPPSATGRILPPAPALATGSSLPPLGDERPFPPKVEESTALPPPPPPPPPSLSHSVSSDATPLPPGTLPPPPAPPGPNG